MRGFYFSLIAIIILMGLFVVLQPTPVESQQRIDQFERDRIVLTNRIIGSFEQHYLDNAVRLQSRMIFDAMGARQGPSGWFLDKNSFEEEFTYALVNGEFTDATEMRDWDPRYDSAPQGLVELLGAYANATGANNNLVFSFDDNWENYGLSLEQDDETGPWLVRVELTIPYNVSAGTGLDGELIADWTMQSQVAVLVDIRGLRDPYLQIGSNRKINRTIDSFETEVWDYDVFEEFYDERAYVPNPTGLSFLGRFYESHEGSSCCGMVTVVHEFEYNRYFEGTPTNEFADISFLDCGYFPSSVASLACRTGNNELLYGVGKNPDPFPGAEVTITDMEIDITDGTIDELASEPTTFPFLLPGGIANEFFNLSLSDELYDAFDVIQ